MNIHSFDLREYLDALAVPYWESGTNVSRGWLGMQCLHCDDSHNHMGVHLYYKNYSCWKCQAKGSLIDLITDLENVSYHIALQRIGEYQSDILQEPLDRETRTDDGGDVLPWGCTTQLTFRQRMWLESRRYTPRTVQDTWGVLAAPPTGKWAHRIICPVQLGGRNMTWVGIDTTGTKTTKYKNAPVEDSFIPTSELLYGMDYVQSAHTVLIVEGMLDAWRMGKGAVAMLGMGVGDWKLQALANLPNAQEYFIMFDGEEPATAKAHELGRALRHMTGKSVNVLELISGDPDDLTDEAATRIRKDIGL